MKAPPKLEAAEARIEIGIGGLEVGNRFPPDSTSVALELELEKGPTLVRTWLGGGKHRSHGAYFVDVKYLGE